MLSRKEDQVIASSHLPFRLDPTEQLELPPQAKIRALKRWFFICATILAILNLFRSISMTSGSENEPKLAFPDLYEASVPELQEGLNAGHFSSVDLVKVRSRPHFHTLCAL